MKNYRLIMIGSGLAAGVATSAWAQKTLVLKINGKVSRHSPMTYKGKTYVPVDAFKDAGFAVKIAGGTVAVTLPGAQTATGGTFQQAAVSGKGGEWLQNGLWRFRVISIMPADPSKDGNGWLAKVEIRNSGKHGGYSPGGTGWQGMTIVLEDGNSIGARSDAVELRDPGLALGASNTQTLYFESESKSRPTKLILRFDPKGLQGTPLKFTVPDPSFRVDIQNVVRPNC